MQETGQGKIGGRNTPACGPLGRAPRETEGSSELPKNGIYVATGKGLASRNKFLRFVGQAARSALLQALDGAGGGSREGVWPDSSLWAVDPIALTLKGKWD